MPEATESQDPATDTSTTTEPEPQSSESNDGPLLESGNFVRNQDGSILINDTGFPRFFIEGRNNNEPFDVTAESYAGTLQNLDEARANAKTLKQELATERATATKLKNQLEAATANAGEKSSAEHAAKIQELEDQLQEKNQQIEKIEADRRSEQEGAERASYLQGLGVFGDGPGTYLQGPAVFNDLFGSNVRKGEDGKFHFYDGDEILRDTTGNELKPEQAIKHLIADRYGYPAAESSFRGNTNGGSGGVDSADPKSPIDRLIIQYAGKSRADIPRDVRQKIIGRASTDPELEKRVRAQIPGIYG